jgi:hypothetical protein
METKLNFTYTHINTPIHRNITISLGTNRIWEQRFKINLKKLIPITKKVIEIYIQNLFVFIFE